MKLKSPYLVKPRTKVRLSQMPTDEPASSLTRSSLTQPWRRTRRSSPICRKCFMPRRSKALLIVLQGMDTAGKDGTIRHIFSGVNPQGCNVASFKVPTPIESRHDFLWRCHAAGPAAGHDRHLQPLAL